jgi:NAD(P)-dependent dehydrogenase (short-subunit alcohol dehydrogenase family)
MDLAGRVILVTGGAGAIGFETCTQLAAAKASVVVNGRNAERSEAAAVQLRARFHGTRVFAIAADIADSDPFRRDGDSRGPWPL